MCFAAASYHISLLDVTAQLKGKAILRPHKNCNIKMHPMWALCLNCLRAQDDTPDEWVHESLIAPDLAEDWARGLERAPVAALLDVQQWGTAREYLVQWADGSPVS